jgi:outer membrane lipoprotein LolB
MGHYRCGFLAALTLLVSGCTHLPGFEPATPPKALASAVAPESFRLEGRVSVKADEESFSGGLVWNRGKGSEELLLHTPLGQGVAELRADSDGVTLTDAKGKIFRAPDADALVRQALGFELPLRGLAWWVVGHPRPGATYRAEPDEAGRLGMLEQDEWRIEFSRYALKGRTMLPGKLVARRGETLEVRLVVDNWELP